MLSRPLALDQIQVFLTVIDQGSFSAAARALNRAQSAVTYAIQELEADLQLPLFDRSAYRPALSDAGRALLPRARNVLHEARMIEAQAAGLRSGLEAELTLVVDSMYPMAALTETLRTFQSAFPSVTTRVHVESLGAAADMVVDGAAGLGLVIALFTPPEGLERRSAGLITLTAVCSPDHPLASRQAETDAILSSEDVTSHVQLVLTDRSPRTRARDYGVAATSTWRLADLGAKHAMLRAGLGWGSMPRHMIVDDLAQGRLVELRLDGWAGSPRLPRIETALIRSANAGLGPAGRWLFDALSSVEIE